MFLGSFIYIIHFLNFFRCVIGILCSILNCLLVIISIAHLTLQIYFRFYILSKYCCWCSIKLYILILVHLKVLPIKFIGYIIFLYGYKIIICIFSHLPQSWYWRNHFQATVLLYQPDDIFELFWLIMPCYFSGIIRYIYFMGYIYSELYQFLFWPYDFLPINRLS